VVRVTDDQLQRLRAVPAADQVPADLMPLVLEIAARVPPHVRLSMAVSELVDRWMVKRRVSHRALSVRRRSLARILKAQNVNLSTVADVADALNCDVVIDFKPRS
jgi:hypothetical protein